METKQQKEAARLLAYHLQRVDSAKDSGQRDARQALTQLKKGIEAIEAFSKRLNAAKSPADIVQHLKDVSDLTGQLESTARMYAGYLKNAHIDADRSGDMVKILQHLADYAE